jgi:hypothetical protein
VAAEETEEAPPSMDEQISGGSSSLVNTFGGTPQRPEVKDLYKSIYKMLKVQPQSSAILKTAEHYEYNANDMQAILKGDIGVLQDTQPAIGNYEALLALFDEMKATHENFLEDEQFQTHMFLDTYPQEIFVNGRTDDSGFDVVYDLEIIELILFGDESTSEGGASGGGLPSFPGGIPSEDSASLPLSGPSPDGGDGGDSASTSTSEDSSSISEEETAIENISDESLTETAETSDPNDDFLLEDNGSLNPLACEADSGLQAAFNDAIPEETQSNDGDDDTNVDADAGGYEDGNASGDGDGETSLPERYDPAHPPYVMERPDGTLYIDSPLKPATPADWSGPPNLCGDIFCLEIKFTNRPDVKYSETANCVQCHVQYIVKTLRDTTAQSLTPGKVSGNLMEPSTCKKSLFNSGVSLNFIPIAMPIKTPDATGLITGVNLVENFGDFMEDALGVDFAKTTDSSKTKGKDIKSTKGDGLDQAILYQNTMSASGDSQQQIYEEALATYDRKQEEIRLKFEESYTAAKFDSSTDFYQSMRYEMDQMNFYFQSFRTSIQLSQEVVEQRKNDLTAAS